MKVSQEEDEMHESKREAKGGRGGKVLHPWFVLATQQHLNSATWRDLFCSVFGSCL